MSRQVMFFLATILAVLVVSISAFPARTAPKPADITWDQNQPETVQAAQVHALVGASFHAVHSSF